MHVEVTPDGVDPYTVIVNGRTVVAWERSGRGNSFSNLQADLKLTDVYGLAYVAAKTSGVYAGSLAEFEATVEVRVVNAPEPDPTLPEV